MAGRSRIAALCFFAVLLFARLAAAQNVRTIYLVRHADKISDEHDALLSEPGHRRAECLGAILADAHVQEIFVSDLQRTQQTAAPLAEELLLKPVIIPMAAPDKLIDAVRGSKNTSVLVIWHGDTLPQVVHALGGPEVAPMGSSEYDRFYILTFEGDATQSKTPTRPRFTALRYCVAPS